MKKIIPGMLVGVTLDKDLLKWLDSHSEFGNSRSNKIATILRMKRLER